MSIWQLWHGGGRRRKSDENWDDLQRQLSDAQARAKHVKGATLNTCQAGIHGPFWVKTDRPLLCPWCEIAKLRGQIEMLTTRPAPRPDTILPEQEPASDVTAETQPVDVRDLRAAMGEGDTQTLPVVTAVVPLNLAQLPPVPWGPGRDPQTAAIEANLGTPAPTPEFAATAVPPDLAKAAHDKVTAALGEAS